jgi:rhodanese-related sulfurtransferase
MKTLNTLMIALLVLIGAVHAQFPVKDTWGRALITTELKAYGPGTDTIHKNITVSQADSLIKANSSNDSIQIIDVRTHDEFIAGHLQNAENINYYDSNFNDQIAALDRDMIYLVYCQAGARSAGAYSTMISLKFREVYNMVGGFKKWKTDGYPYDVDTTTGISDNQTIRNEISLYPNPASDKLIVETNQDLNPGTLSIFNSNGQVLISRHIAGSRTEINIVSLPKGIYILKLVSDRNIFVQRFIKQ